MSGRVNEIVPLVMFSLGCQTIYFFYFLNLCKQVNQRASGGGGFSSCEVVPVARLWEACRATAGAQREDFNASGWQVYKQ